MARKRTTTKKKTGRRAPKAKPKAKGFKHWSVDWQTGDSPRGTHFEVKTEDARFFGAVREQSKDWMVVVSYDRFMETGLVAQIPYTKNPTANRSSLDADICAAIQEWLSMHPYEGERCAICNATEHQAIAPTNACVKHLKSLVKAPIIRIRKLPTLDNLIMELTRVRMDTLRCGGERGLAIQGDTADSVRPWMTVVLSRYAVALQGRQVPSIGSFILPEDMPQTKSPVAAKGKKGRRARKAGASLPPPPTPSASTGSGSDALNSLVSKLADATDPAEKRRLRKALRKLGHRGGARSTKGTE